MQAELLNLKQMRRELQVLPHPAPSAGNQEEDRVDVGGASVSVAVENSATATDDKSKDNTLASLTISEGTLSPGISVESYRISGKSGRSGDISGSQRTAK